MNAHMVGDGDSDAESEQGDPLPISMAPAVPLAQRQRLLLRFRRLNNLGDQAPLQPQHLTDPIMAAFMRWYCWGFGLASRPSHSRSKVRITLGTLAVEHERLGLPFLADQAFYPLLIASVRVSDYCKKS
ncbi:hypothetical protein B484DRAFT_397053 [Ochromonadaceae sp. CCMP2298]|nr:hypothetical protein B484DRAFT_397053 [Ochromonadaceae sp. CCMP2298]